MANLFLAPTMRYFGIGDSSDYVVLDGARVIGRIVRLPIHDLRLRRGDLKRTQHRRSAHGPGLAFV
jgi:hypothetical protein